MAADIDPNTISKKQEKQAEHIADKLQDKGFGQDDAKNKALEEVAQQGNTRQADAPKKSDEHRDARGEEETSRSKAE